MQYSFPDLGDPQCGDAAQLPSTPSMVDAASAVSHGEVSGTGILLRIRGRLFPCPRGGPISCCGSTQTCPVISVQVDQA